MLHVDDSADLLEQLGSELAGCRGVEAEFSLRLQAGSIEDSGRFCFWLPSTDSPGLAPMARALSRIGAPAQVLEAQARNQGSVREGLGVSIRAGIPEFRLYLHNRRPDTFIDRYCAWRWRYDRNPEHSTYNFHFMPETPLGQRPLDLVSSALRPAFRTLLAHKRFRQISGFWLRTKENSDVDQVDLAFPWSPCIGSLNGLLELAQILELPPKAFALWRDLCIRHVAAGAGFVSIYASAPLNGPWPLTERELQERVRNNAREMHDDFERSIFCHLPAQSSILSGSSMPDAFYEGNIDTWRAILGPDMHYHAGLFDHPASDPSDADMYAALRKAVTELYRFLPAGGRLYDVGCGWGGPLAMIIQDLHCRGLGVTVSRNQFQHVASLGLPVRWADAERTLPPGHFDCALLLESLSHIRDKHWLLQVLRVFAGRLVMRVNCQDAAPSSTNFGDSMHMISSTQLRELLVDTGWRIRHWRDRRAEAIPSVFFWYRRLQFIPCSGDPHMETLRAWCAKVVNIAASWAANNSLIEVVAD